VKILNEALKLNGGTHAYAKHPKTFRLLGHSSVKVTEAYYAKWVASRKVRLEPTPG
jgi:hypothetical protein